MDLVPRPSGNDREGQALANIGNNRNRTPFLLYGVLFFSLGIMTYLLGVVLVIPRYLLGLHDLLDPVAAWLV